MGTGPSDVPWHDLWKRLRATRFSEEAAAEAIAGLWCKLQQAGARPRNPRAFLLGAARRKQADELRRTSRIRAAGDLARVPAPAGKTEGSIPITPWPRATRLVHRALLVAGALTPSDRELASASGLSLALLHRLEAEVVATLDGSIPSAVLEALAALDASRACEERATPPIPLRLPRARDDAPEAVLAGRFLAVVRAYGFTLEHVAELLDGSTSTIQRLSASFYAGRRHGRIPTEKKKSRSL